jgi:hypothetical protein
MKKLTELGQTVHAEDDGRWRDVAELLSRYGYRSSPRH